MIKGKKTGKGSKAVYVVGTWIDIYTEESMEEGGASEMGVDMEERRFDNLQDAVDHIEAYIYTGICNDRELREWCAAPVEGIGEGVCLYAEGMDQCSSSGELSEHRASIYMEGGSGRKRKKTERAATETVQAEQTAVVPGETPVEGIDSGNVVNMFAWANDRAYVVRPWDRSNPSNRRSNYFRGESTEVAGCGSGLITPAEQRAARDKAREQANRTAKRSARLPSND